MITVIITLTSAGSDTGPFDLYSNIDGFLTPFESSVAKVDLEAGYISYLVPDGTSTVRVQSSGSLCQNFIDLSIGTTTTTTSTSSTSSTTTTTTTMNPAFYDFYLADAYACGTCELNITNVPVAFPTGTSVIIGRYYAPTTDTGYVYRIVGTTSPTVGPIMTTTPYTTCEATPCIV